MGSLDNIMDEVYNPEEFKFVIDDSPEPIVCLAFWSKMSDAKTLDKTEDGIDSISRKFYNKASFYKINTDERWTERFVLEYGITRIPTFLFFVGGEMVFKIDGDDPKFVGMAVDKLSKTYKYRTNLKVLD